MTSNYLYSDDITLTSTWKIVKNPPNHIPMNMIGLDHTSREGTKDGDILILPKILITPKSLQPSV